MSRKCFYSFHYEPDSWRAAQVRNMGILEGNAPATDNDWEQIKKGGDRSIEQWISQQLYGRACTIVLVGARTAGRHWIDHEITESWNREKGVVGLRIHRLKGFDGMTSRPGENPFEHLTFGTSGRKLSSVVKCYDPAGSSSKEVYAWIEKNLSNMVEEAIGIREDH